MKKILLFFVAMLTCCGAVHANPISVRSGEHPTFTRLVMPLPENSSWKIENQVGRSTLILDNFSHGFDLTFAFDIIPRTRLSELVGEESELVMQLNCDCQVNAFVEENGFLVVDISDGPDFILLPEPENLSSQLPKSSYSYGDLLWNGVQNSIVEIDTDVQLPSLMDTGELNAEHSGEAPSEIVSLTRDRLVTAFADAATRGLIDTDQGSLLEIQSENETAPEQEIFDSSNVQTMESATITGNIRVTNSKDVPNAPAQPGTGVSGSTCPNPEIVNIAEWGSELSFAAQMGQANIDLVDELGRYRKDEVLKRIKLYLFFGFGAEAAQTIKLVNYLGKDYPELVDLSNIMEYGYAKNPRLLHRFADCDSDLALWGILSAQEVPLEYPINPHAALRALQNLPSHLRYFLSEELSKRLLERGDHTNASIAMRNFERLEQNDVEHPTITKATSSGLRGDKTAEREILTEIIARDGPDAPNAIIALINNHIEKNEPVKADIALLAEVYAFELRNSDLGNAMQRASILASIKSTQYSKAIQVLDTEKGELDKEIISELRSYLFSELSKNADDAEFLDNFFKYFWQWRLQLDHSAKLEVAQRLFETGFVKEAFNLVSEFPPDFQPAALKILRSEMFLGAGLYVQALNEIDGLQGVVPLELKAKILEASGENFAAANSFNDAKMPDRATSALWLSDQWDEAMDGNHPIFGALKSLSNEFPINIVDDDALLSLTEDAIASSSAARVVIENVLGELQLSE